MRVTVFAGFDTRLNPYILLFKEALEHQGIAVELERDFSLKWLLTKGKSSDCIHLHWINWAFKVAEKETRYHFLKRLIDNRFTKAMLRVLGLIHFSIALLFAKMKGKIIVCTVHDLDHFVDYFGKRSWRGIMLNRMAHYMAFLLSNHIHVHNHYSRQLIESRYKKRQGIAVIPHGNYIGYYPNLVSRAEARRQLDLPKKAFIYLFLGLLRPHKGLEDLFEAFERLEIPNTQLLVAGKIFGDISYHSKLTELSKNNSKIKLVPEFIPDESIQLYMNACDVCVLPYKHITTSGAAALAFSFGRPVVAPAITSFPEVITSETGILYNISEPNGLTSALLQAKNRSWSEPEIFNYAQQFDWTKLGPQLITLYRRRPGEKDKGKGSVRG